MNVRRVVQVGEQRFAAPEKADNEQIRQTLLTAGFADVANATIETRTETESGTTVEIIEFKKTGGTKGLDGVTFTQLLAAVPRRVLIRRPAQVSPKQRHLIYRLINGKLSNQEATEQADLILAGLYKFVGKDCLDTIGGSELCTRLSALPAVAVERDGCVW